MLTKGKEPVKIKKNKKHLDYQHFSHNFLKKLKTYF